MQVMVGFVGIGFGYKNFQVSGMNMGKIRIRHSFYDSGIIRLQIHDMLSVGARSASWVGSAFETEWFDINPKTNTWVYDLPIFLNFKARLEVDGPLFKNTITDMLGAGKAADALGLGESYQGVKVALYHIDKYGEEKKLFSHDSAPVRGGIQVSHAKVTGILQNSNI
jgi:hypothetical protein